MSDDEVWLTSDETYATSEDEPETTIEQRIHKWVYRDAGTFQPKVDIHESLEQNLVTATLELPGLGVNDVYSYLDKDRGKLIIWGQKKDVKVVVSELVDGDRKALVVDVEEGGFVRRECEVGRFVHTFTVPPGTKGANIRGAFKYGLLTVTFPLVLTSLSNESELEFEHVE